MNTEATPPHRPRNIVVFSDGTGQDGGVRPDQRLSNVYKLYRATRIGPDSLIDPAEQIAFYDPGLGTDSDAHGATRLRRKFVKALGSVAGRGIAINIIDCYEFICNHWRPGDRVYLVGFSRGAYTVRCVAQVLSLCGVPTHDRGDPTAPFRRFARSTRLAATRAVRQVYEHGAGHERAKFEAERDEQARRFRVDFGSGDPEVSNASPYFVGVFDTVAALGAAGWKRWGMIAGLASAAAVPLAIAAVALERVAGLGFIATFATLAATASTGAWLLSRRDAKRFIDDFPELGAPRRSHHVEWRAANYDRGLSGHVGYARQASAIDETRSDFPRVPWGRKDVIRARQGDEPEPLVQLFFAGNHSDVGGSYPEVESRLSDVSLEWMVDEATSLPHPLIVDRAKLALWPDPLGLQHDEPASLRETRLWWVPDWAPAWLRRGWPEKHRKARGYPVHPSVYARFAAPEVGQFGRDAQYRPAALDGDTRFAGFVTGEDPVTTDALRSQAEALVTIHASDREFSFRGAGEHISLRELVEGQGAENAVAMLAEDAHVADASEYYGRLALAALARQLDKIGSKHLPMTSMTTGETSRVLRGLVAFDLSPGSARELARSTGQLVFMTIDMQGAVSIELVFASAGRPGG